MSPAFSVTITLSLLALCFVLLSWCSNFRSDAQLLPLQEVQILRTIMTKLQNKTVNVEQTSCTDGRWNFNQTTLFRSSFTCNCTFNNNTLCHVTNIQLKGQNLPGIVPPEFGSLTHLQEIDLALNYLNGSIPTSLTRIPLRILSLIGNRLSGRIPPEIGDITTLEELVLEDNLFSGQLPSRLGNLVALGRLLLSSNNFTGIIPESFSKLKNLTDFRIDGTSLSGKIPDFIGKLTKLDALYMQGTNMQGPIPYSISLLKNLKKLRISDLSGPASTFPNLKGMMSMQMLALKNCLITGPIPKQIGEMSSLYELDLSFNQLTGPIPETFQSLNKMKYMFLTNNSLSGTVPEFLPVKNQQALDLSYNNFTNPPQVISCTNMNADAKGNLVSGYLSSTDNQSVSWCFKKGLPCPGKATHHSLFINCGGKSIGSDGNVYEEDLSPAVPSTFVSTPNWGYSSTGIFTGNDSALFTTNNISLNMTGEPEYYNSARLSPSSLKYYGLCMMKGSYNVKLHFAEIMYTDDMTFNSLGRRVFDIYIQGVLVRKEFNIAEKAGGVNKKFTDEFNNIIVDESTLEIHLLWSGKGTTAIPYRGVYGPLISAISVTPNFKVSTGPSIGAILVIVAASVVVVGLLLLLLWKLGYLGGKDLEDKELRALNLQTGYFTLRDIKAATNSFDPANKIGEGGFGPVYKGELSDGKVIAVKQLSAKSKQGNREFVNEIGMISALQHPNLVKLYGCCIEGNQLLLVYEYLENNSLARALFGKEDQLLHLNWPTRNRICIQIAKGLAYLHEESRLKIVHRDIKATNVLLDKDLNAKISDFGLAKLDEDENTHISTRIAGTIGYMAPEYAMRGYLTDKADVYSFGVVCLEIVSGKSNTNYRPKDEFVYLLDWAYVLQEQGNLLELVDPDLGKHYPKKEALRMINLALLCTNQSPTLRPNMSSAVSMLEGKIPVEAPIIKRDGMNPDARFKAFESLSQDSQTQVTSSSQDTQMQRTVSMDGSWIESSTTSLPRNANTHNVHLK